MSFVDDLVSQIPVGQLAGTLGMRSARSTPGPQRLEAPLVSALNDVLGGLLGGGRGD